MKFRKAIPKKSGVYIVKFEKKALFDRYELVYLDLCTNTISDYPNLTLADEIGAIDCKWGELIDDWDK